MKANDVKLTIYYSNDTSLQYKHFKHWFTVLTCIWHVFVIPLSSEEVLKLLIEYLYILHGNRKTVARYFMPENFLHIKHQRILLDKLVEAAQNLKITEIEIFTTSPSISHGRTELLVEFKP